MTKIMSREKVFTEFIAKVKKEAYNNSWVVITDKGCIWGSESSLSSLKMGGGKRFILTASFINVGNMYPDSLHADFPGDSGQNSHTLMEMAEIWGECCEGNIENKAEKMLKRFDLE